MLHYPFTQNDAFRGQVKTFLLFFLDAKRSIASGDHFAIFDHFDTFFSIIENAKTVQKVSMTRASDHLYQAIDFLGKFLSELLANNDIPEVDRSPALNATKMLVYAAIGLVKVVDQAILAANDGIVKKGRKVSVNFFLSLP
jgi:condensin complex subunit 1